MKVGLWSTSAGANTTAVPDGWPEGQPPSSVNNCAREMMAATRVYLDDAEWFDHGFSPTFINANSFSITGNQLSFLSAGRAIKLHDVTDIIRSVQTASFTTVTTVQLNSGSAITASMSSFAKPGRNWRRSVFVSIRYGGRGTRSLLPSSR